MTTTLIQDKEVEIQCSLPRPQHSEVQTYHMHKLQEENYQKAIQSNQFEKGHFSFRTAWPTFIITFSLTSRTVTSTELQAKIVKYGNNKNGKDNKYNGHNSLIIP